MSPAGQEGSPPRAGPALVPVLRWPLAALAATLLGAAPQAQAGETARRHGKPAVAGVLNVNQASEAELRLLPGIGKGRAQAIVERRKQRRFASLDEVARLKGMRGVIQKLRRHLVVEGESTLRPAPAVPPKAPGPGPAPGP